MKDSTNFMNLLEMRLKQEEEARQKLIYKILLLHFESLAGYGLEELEQEKEALTERKRINERDKQGNQKSGNYA